MSGLGSGTPGGNGTDGSDDRPWGLLNVVADLEISVDGTTGHLSGDGDRLVLTSTHPERIWTAAAVSALPSALGSVNGPKAIGAIADQLAGSGVRLEVTGPRGDVVTLGRGVQSRLGRALTGSSAVSPGGPGALAALVWRQVPPAAALGAAVLAAGALWIGFRRVYPHGAQPGRLRG